MLAMRTFIAIDIPAAIRSEIRKLVASLRAVAPQLRWSRPEGWHITLKFIGEISPARVEQVKSVLAALPPAPPIQISIRQAGFFPNERRPRTFWLGVEADPGLGSLVGRIDKELAALNIARETRDFSPHLTMARIEDGMNARGLQEALPNHGRIDMGSFAADEFYLYESKLASGGSVYTRLSRFHLSG